MPIKHKKNDLSIKSLKKSDDLDNQSQKAIVDNGNVSHSPSISNSSLSNKKLTDEFQSLKLEEVTYT